MRLAYLAVAGALALAGFTAVEAAGTRAGVWTALTDSTLLDALVYVLTWTVLALLFAPLFRRARSWRAPFAILGFVLLFAPLAGLLAALSETVRPGAAPAAAGVFLGIPVNLVYTYVVDLPIVALPLGIASAAILWWMARRAGTARRSAAAAG
jgi:hypothetical protein